MFGKTTRTTLQTPSPETGRMRFERDARVFASDGPVGILRQIVVDEETGEITMLVIAPEDGSSPILVPASLLHRSAGSALFLSVTRSQFARAAARATRFDMAGYQRTNLKHALRRASESAGSALPVLGSAAADVVEARMPGEASAVGQPARPAAAAVVAPSGAPAAESAAASAPRRLLPVRLPRRKTADSDGVLAASGD